MEGWLDLYKIKLKCRDDGEFGRHFAIICPGTEYYQWSAYLELKEEAGRIATMHMKPTVLLDGSYEGFVKLEFHVGKDYLERSGVTMYMELKEPRIMSYPSFYYSINLMDLWELGSPTQSENGNLKTPDLDSGNARPTNFATMMDNVIGQIGEKVPELKLENRDDEAHLRFEENWQSKNIKTASFTIRDKARFYPDGTFPRQPTPVPIIDVDLKVIQYDSPDHVERNVERNLTLRPRSPTPKETYKGAVLYKYMTVSGEISRAICLFGRHVIEVSSTTTDETKLVMQVLDVALAELESGE